MRRILALVALVAIAGCTGPLADVPVIGAGSDKPAGAPASDVVGWEDGYWYNASLDVDASDGLDDQELQAVVARAKARVERIRGVEFAGETDVRTVSRSSFDAGGGGATPHPDRRAFDNAKMESLLLVGEDENSLATQRRNRQVSVGGYYSPSSDRIVVVTDGENAVVDELTLAHELVHAWQDQRFGLGSFDARTRDGDNAESGIVEGDANYVEYLYRKRCGQQWDCVVPERDGGGGGGLANYGTYVLSYFPYSDGPSFVAHRRQAGGWEAVNEVYRDPPASAEQVAHPEKYGSDPPTEVTLRDSTAGDWERVRPPDRPDYGEVGQAGVAALFVYPLYHSGGNESVVPADVWLNRTADGVSRLDPFDYGFGYAAGWDGDRLHVYRDGDGDLGYVWRIAWDSRADAREFVRGYRRVLAYWGAERVDEHTYRIADGPFADAFHVTANGSTVTVVNAPRVDELSGVRTTLGAGARPVTETPSSDGVSAPTPGFGPVVGLLAALLAAALLSRRC